MVVAAGCHSPRRQPAAGVKLEAGPASRFAAYEAEPYRALRQKRFEEDELQELEAKFSFCPRFTYSGSHSIDQQPTLVFCIWTPIAGCQSHSQYKNEKTFLLHPRIAPVTHNNTRHGLNVIKRPSTMTLPSADKKQSNKKQNNKKQSTTLRLLVVSCVSID